MIPTQLLLTFADKETADYVKTVCRRKGTSLESYILGNMEWDTMPECIESEYDWKTCHSCDYSNRCPDARKKR
jgi:hypothetical protein